ncbi:sulfurtransferase TusA family protein [Acidiferrobacter thiooxydans]|jgi:TusA-related sulfurtransferase|uniref:Sulfurtransferase TusA family protein n=1 Tax=Acidiferrobacter thiooxydans TaxID=163359 RepID=A0A1C2G3W7_9GAMM|nr:sulfurtransferase TusA family protein [Acidiferrobacter thiooxydans]RCN56800.1 sulfurtransferase TusA family protein [Acidiferrobacter thiooxydans]UEN99482.1 sulfurtransferase TusA family protein [Acidiferrobacter thiooxydans]
MSEVRIVDARGSFCPGPLMELIAAMKTATIGEELEVLSTDRGSAEDIPEWIKKVGHTLVSSSEEGGVYHLRVRKTK